MTHIKDNYKEIPLLKESRGKAYSLEASVPMDRAPKTIAADKTDGALKERHVKVPDKNAGAHGTAETSLQLEEKQRHGDNDAPASYATSLATARFPNGTLGYVADPTALRKGIAAFLSNETLFVNENNITLLLSLQPQLYWRLLADYESEYRKDTYSGQEVLSPDYTCALGPGRGLEQDYGYRLLSEKIQIYNTDENGDSSHNAPRILCLIYTYPKMRDLQRTQALTWGHQCDGYLAFSTETIASLGILNLTHEGEESYDNMWQKVRSIWTFVHQHYLSDFDFFHLGGDDLYVIVANMRKFLMNYMNTTTPVYLGQWIPLAGDNKYFVSGGPGYTLNRVALKRLVEDALPNCRIHFRASYEDRLISQCLRDINITGGDTRNVATGEQLYHDCGPAHLYTFRSTKGRGSFHAKAAAYWETLPHPTDTSTLVGPKHELEAAGTYSVTFHDIYHPLYMARLHSILYPGICPVTSALGRALAATCDARENA